MNNKIELLLSEGAVEEIAQHAQETFPEECCGVILTDGTVDRVHRLKNIQNQLHALDPQTYPRTAIIAYAMDYKELELVLDQAKRNGAKLKAFYHSHPNHGSHSFRGRGPRRRNYRRRRTTAYGGRRPHHDAQLELARPY